MKKITTFLFLTLLMFSLSASNDKKPVSTEAMVSWNKIDKGISYTITFDKEYKINRSAPFNFFLLDKDKKEITKVKWEMFTYENDLKYVFVSDKKESFAKYWFVACKYQNNEVVSCKTFSNTIEIK
ncbi:MAG TPA: hypothetical protein PL195_04770 [bacterium]|nr:hypothetical protein [bacterium]HQJ61603.1 hypothetical protein [bacterium]